MEPATKLINGLRLPKMFSDETVQKSLELEPEPGDIILATYPKCGTHWTKQILILLMNNGLPLKDGKEFLTTCPFLEFTGPDVLLNQTPPRCYFCHFDYSRIPKSNEAKYICVIRNPKDCLISLYHFIKHDHFEFKDGEFDVLFNLFIRGEVIYNDYFDHLMSWYERRNDTNVLFLYYEKMKDDIEKAVKDIARFMGSKYEDMIKDANVLDNVLEYSSFDYMKSNTNKLMKQVIKSKVLGTSSDDNEDADQSDQKETVEFVRKGIVGDWKSVMTTEQNQILDSLIEKRINGTEMYEYWKSIGCI